MQDLNFQFIKLENFSYFQFILYLNSFWFIFYSISFCHLFYSNLCKMLFEHMKGAL